MNRPYVRVLVVLLALTVFGQLAGLLLGSPKLTEDCWHLFMSIFVVYALTQLAEVDRRLNALDEFNQATFGATTAQIRINEGVLRFMTGGRGNS